MVLVELSTTQMMAFKTAFEAINSLLSETNFEFSSNGITIRDIDKTGRILVSAVLEANKFDSYKFDCNYSKYNIGVNIDSIVRGIKCYLNYDILDFKFDSPKDVKPSMKIELSNKERNDKKICHIKMCSVMTNENVIKSLDYTYRATMKPQIFGKYIKDLNHICNNLTFKINKDKIIIYGYYDDELTTEVHLNQITDGLSIISEVDTNCDVIKNIDMKYLLILNKCNNLSQEISMYFSNDHPITIEYPLASIGVLRMVLL
jgi:proliferating cell nuclear antigen PCNA